MCYNCGCGIPEDDMGHKDNITEDKLEELSKKIGKDLHETKHYLLFVLEAYFEKNKDLIKDDEHLTDLFEKASNAWGQDKKIAMKEAYKLLKKQHSH